MNAKDTGRLRDLAKTVKEYSLDPVNEKHRKIWTAVNDRKMIIPAVMARDYPAYLINWNDEMTTTIEAPFFREIELMLLEKIYEWKHMRCNRVIEDIVYCPVAVTDTRFGIQISAPEKMMDHQVIDKAVHFDRIIDNEADLEKIARPEISYDEKETMERKTRMEEVFGDILRVKLQGIDHFHFAPWDDLLSWMNIEEGMYGFVENPDFMHKAVSRYVEMSIYRARRYEEMGILSSNNRNVNIAAGGYGYTTELPPPTESGIGARLKDNWGDGRDQIFTSISPAMSAEFGFAYEKQWADLFGMSYYGCCENLDHKVEEAKQLPRLRKISMSPYARAEEMMERVGSDMVISFKANSNYLAFSPWQKDLLKAELIKVCGLARKYGCSMEILMKTLIHLDGDPTRLWEWCDMATDIAANY